MNWNKASNLLIICLVILNIALSYMLNLNSLKYTLDTEQISFVTRLLEKNDIDIKSILRNFPPMRVIDMSAYTYDNEMLKELFLGTSSDIRRTTEFNKTKYTKSSETLLISTKIIEYTNESANNKKKPSVETAKKTVQEFYAGKLMKKLPGFKFNSVNETGEAVIIDYRGFYKDNIIYSNYIQFTVSTDGITSIICEYQKPNGYYGDKKQLCTPDEALVTFMYEARKETSLRLSVEKMDLVYYPVEAAADSNAIIRATPYYRIYVAGRLRPFLINAYTNTIH